MPNLNPGNGSYDAELLPMVAVNNVSARLGVRFGNFDLSVFANNLLNAQPILAHNRDTSSATLFKDVTVRPRTIGITGSFRY